MAGILVGYARVSTCDQQAGLDAQVRDLKAAGCEEIFAEQVSAVAQRDRLKEALRFVRRGDTLVACKPDRLARSTTDLWPLQREAWLRRIPQLIREPNRWVSSGRR